MSTLMVSDNRGGKYSSYQEVLAQPLPVKTETYQPVAHGDLLDLIAEETDKRGLVPLSAQYALSGKSRQTGDYGQFFGILTYEGGREDNALTIGLRNSYDKSLSAAMACGAAVFVCTNLCLSGEGVTFFRKHTKNIGASLKEMVRKMVDESQANYEDMNLFLDDIRQYPVDLDRGYEIIGRAQGHKLLKPRQAAVAYADWTEPRHEEFEERNLYSLYNCFTEGLKKGQANDIVERHTRATEFFKAFV